MEAGLSTKLCPWQVPELVALCIAFQEVAEALQDAPLPIRARATCRACLILRAVRGCQGVRWMRDLFARKPKFKALLLQQDDGRAIMNTCKWLRSEMTQENAQRGNSVWSAHREGRHTCYSGWHAVNGLCTAEGSAGTAEIVVDLADIFSTGLAAGPSVHICLWRTHGWLNFWELRGGACLLQCVPKR